MSYKIEGRDIVFGGFEEGISDNPYEGINDMRGVNIVSVPGEASVSYATTNLAPTSCTGSVTSANAGTDEITVTISTGSLVTYQAVVFTGGALPAGITAATVYWVLKVSGTVFQIYNNPFLNGSPVNITGTGTGTFATVNMSEIVQFEKSVNACVDSSGRVWTGVISSDVYVFLGNPLPATQVCAGQGIQWVAKGDVTATTDGYLFVYMSSRMSYIRFAGPGAGYYATATWISEWDPATGASNPGVNVFNTQPGESTRHPSLYSSNDGAIYIGDGIFIASLRKKATAASLDLTSTASYTWTQRALPIPTTDQVKSVAELGTNLLIGGQYNYVYPWDRVSVGYSYPIVIGENNAAHMVTINTNTYIFAGNRGRIYVTNGSQAQLYKKIPDHISSGIDPLFTWKGAMYYKNQLYFGIYAQSNTQSVITSYSGLWAIDITTNALRVVSIPTTSTAYVTSVYASPIATGLSGFGVYYSWSTGSVYGIDSSTSASPYSSYGPFIITDFINVGQYLTKRTFENVEWKLSTPLTSSESIKVSYRTNLTEAFTQLGETTTAGLISDVYNMNFENVQWVQFKIEQKSSSSSSSFVRLRELRLR